MSMIRYRSPSRANIYLCEKHGSGTTVHLVSDFLKIYRTDRAMAWGGCKEAMCWRRPCSASVTIFMKMVYETGQVAE